MSTLRPEEHQRSTEKIGKTTIRLTTCRIGEIYRCEVDNIDPGAKIARGTGPTRERAEASALEKAKAVLPR